MNFYGNGKIDVRRTKLGREKWEDRKHIKEKLLDLEKK